MKRELGECSFRPQRLSSCPMAVRIYSSCDPSPRTARWHEIIRLTRANRPVSDGVYLFITAYSVTSALTTEGDCVTISATPIGVVTASKPSSTDSERLQLIVETDFVAWMDRAPTCSLGPTCIGNDCLFGDEPDDGNPLLSPGTVSVLQLPNELLIPNLTFTE